MRGFRIGHPRQYTLRPELASFGLSGFDVGLIKSTVSTDTQAPSAPGIASITVLSPSAVGLFWVASTDNVGVTQYEVSRRIGAGAWSVVATPAGTSHTDVGLSASTTYQYRQRARDAAGNWSDYSPISSVTTAASGTLWSDPATWGGQVPIEGQNVTIPAGKTVVLDVVTPSLGSLDIDGTLQVRNDTGTYGLTVKQAHLMGSFLIGNSAADRFPGQFTMTFTGPNTGDAHDRGMMLHHHAVLRIFGRAPTLWSKLNQHANAGATALTLKDTVDWKAGDEIIVGPTDWYVLGGTERRTLSAVSGSNLTLSSGLSRFKWGRLIYPTNSGPSLTPGTFTLPDPDHPTQADFRAPVGNITRNVVFQSINDAAWQDTQFGYHIMVMDLESEVYIDGAKFLRGGQQGITGRYPFHWHLPSWTKSGPFAVEPRLGQYAPGKAVIRNCVVENSGQRGLVIHGADGVLLERNICYDIKGHAIFLEDATERHNVIAHNLVCMVRAPHPSRLLMHHERDNTNYGSEQGSSGFWITNLDNDFLFNHACDCNGGGFWISVPQGPLNLSGPGPLGLGGGVNMRPNNVAMGRWEDNTAHSCAGAGEVFRGVVINPAGNTSLEPFYQPTTDGMPGNFDDGRAIFENPFLRNTIFKCGRGAHVNRVSHVQYIGGVSADNYGQDFAGSTAAWRVDKSIVRACWMMGYSLNNATEDKPPPYIYDHEDQVRAGGATYHSTLFFKNNTFMSFRPVIQVSSYPGEINGGGALLNDDYYTDPVEWGPVYNTGNVLINAFPGYRDTPPNLAGTMASHNRHFTFAGAVWDPPGWHGPAGNFWCFNHPFFTYGEGSIHYTSPVEQNNGVSIPGPFYAFQSYTLDGVGGSSNRAAMRASRRNPATGEEVAFWEVTRSPNNGILSNMRHFAAKKDGEYILTFPGETAPTTFRAAIGGVKDASDAFLVGIQMHPSATPTSVRYMARNTAATGASRRDCSPAASKAAVKAGSGNLYYHDTSANLLWVKFTGGLPWFGAPPPITDLNYYRWSSVFLVD